MTRYEFIFDTELKRIMSIIAMDKLYRYISGSRSNIPSLTALNKVLKD